LQHCCWPADRAAIGRYAAELILARIDGDTSPKVVDVGFEIVDRATM
jgi:DNA-binding LacI/PurR family transcriptional regulator